MDKRNLISKNIKEIRAKLSHETLVVVSKNVDEQDIQMAFEVGQIDFGESRVLELIEKAKQLKNLPIRWHFVGTLQRNKVKKLLGVRNLLFIHSVDNLNILQELLKNKGLVQSPIGLFLQVNTSGEVEKHGFAEIKELKNAAFKIKDEGSPSFYLHGLMTIGGIRGQDFEQDASRSFRKLKEFKNELVKDNFLLHLSMGMSMDYEIALKEGTDYLRIGSAVFKG